MAGYNIIEPGDISESQELSVAYQYSDANLDNLKIAEQTRIPPSSARQQIAEQTRLPPSSARQQIAEQTRL